MRRFTALLPALACLALALPACGCPPLVPRWDTPEATLANWQANFCRDDVKGEYGCLAASFQDAIAGFPSYFAARARLLEEQPATAWVLAHADLDERVAPAIYEPDGQTAHLALEARGERVEIGFECEAWITVTYADGTTQLGRQRATPAALVGGDASRQWMSFERPPFDPARLADIRSVHVDARWLIADLAGLAGPAPADTTTASLASSHVLTAHLARPIPARDSPRETP
jgi:hypothetical protein